MSLKLIIYNYVSLCSALQYRDKVKVFFPALNRNDSRIQNLSTGFYRQSIALEQCRVGIPQRYNRKTYSFFVCLIGGAATSYYFHSIFVIYKAQYKLRNKIWLRRSFLKYLSVSLQKNTSSMYIVHYNADSVLQFVQVYSV